MTQSHDKTDQKTSEKDVPFGFQRVREEDKQGLVNDVFSKAASRYDLMNDLMSGGLHRLWKDDFVTHLNPPRDARSFHVLDMAGGTGDITFRILRAGGPGTHVTVGDISEAMLGEGRLRAEREGLAERCSFLLANAETLPFPDKHFDAYTIAFGIRNVTRIEQALAEAYRVLKPGGHFLCLEFSTVNEGLLKRAYDAFSFTAIPAIGKLVTGDGQPYRYLVESIRTFPKQEQFRDMIAAAGFTRASYRNMTGGIVAMHSGWRV